VLGKLSGGPMQLPAQCQGSEDWILLPRLENSFKKVSVTIKNTQLPLPETQSRRVPEFNRQNVKSPQIVLRSEQYWTVTPQGENSIVGSHLGASI
jgi:hypothetical protein